MCLCDPAPLYLPSAPAPPLHPASSVPCAPLPLSVTWRPAAATCVEGEGGGQIYLGLIHGVACTGVDSLAKARQKSSGSNRSISVDDDLGLELQRAGYRLLILGERADVVEFRGDEGALGLPN